MAAFAVVALVKEMELNRAALDTAVVVERVIDGDTIVLTDGRRVRYIGIDSPEMDAASERSRALAARAHEFNIDLVEGKTVRLESDVERIDRYGRTLAYVYVEDQFINLELVRAGLARAKIYGKNHLHSKALAAAEDEAKAARAGIWAE
jgi:micrococcal nuclease